MENCDLIDVKEEPVFEDYFYTIREVSEDEDEIKEPEKEATIIPEPEMETLRIPISDQSFSLQCQVCNKGFLPKEFKVHLATAHIYVERCLKCKEAFPSKWHLSRHEVVCNNSKRLNNLI